MPKLTLEERRKETLRRQLYGREVVAPKVKTSVKTEHSAFNLSDYNSSTSHSETLETNYLTKDLSKILIFSVMAIGVQFSLYFLLQAHVVKLPF